MATNFLTRLFGSRNDRLIRQYRKTVEKINGLEASMTALTDEQLQAKTGEFRERLGKGEELNAILPEAFAVVREASKRVMKMRHFDVQMLGGLALHDGKIAEMRTGEGKTLTASLPGDPGQHHRPDSGLQARSCGWAAGHSAARHTQAGFARAGGGHHDPR